MSITVAVLRRYPVKSMGGEALDRVELDGRGLVGDRWFAVADGDGRFASGKSTRRFRRYDQVFDYRAQTVGDGVVVSADHRSWPVGSPELDRELTERFGTPVRVVPEAAVPHQDGGAVSLIGTATLAWCAERWHVDPDPRRLRVNILLRTDEPFAEEAWLGRAVSVGGATLRCVEPAERCRMIDIAQDGTSPTDRWLPRLADERQLKLAVYADVVVPGVVAVGDPVAERTAWSV